MKRLFLLLLIITPLVLLTLIYLSNNHQRDLINSQASTQISPSQASPTPTQIPIATIGLVGDLGLGRHITSTARAKNDFNWSFRQISPWLQSNDINFANLESPIIKDCPLGVTGTFTFCGDDRFLPYLKDNKFAFTLANNHMFNYGADGFSQTKIFLDNQAIPYVYSHNTDTEFRIITINGINFGILGYDFITNPSFDTQTIIDKVIQYDSQVDWLIVSLHWGNEYKPEAEKWRVNLAHQLVDAGADIIHGHHPHVWQPEEVYKDKLIYYSLGNFIFDQSWSYETSHTNIIQLQLTKDQIKSTIKTPVEIKFNSQPVIMVQN